ncbi:MAG: alpha/beta hydrolase [Pseudomonadota bacterium]
MPPTTPTLLCLHCSASNGQQWKAYPALLPAPLRLLTPDLLGYGSAPAWPTGASLSLDTEAQRLAPLLDAGGANDGDEGVHLFGHSYGGAVALQLALRWPQRVRSLTLYEPVRFAALRDDRDPAPWRDIRAFGRMVGGLASIGHHEAAAACFIDYWSGQGAWARLPVTRQQAIAARMAKVGADFEALFDDAVPLAAYRRLTMPVRLITGTTSPAPARRVAERLAQILPDATLVRLHGLGHMGPLEDPQRVAARLAPMLVGEQVDQAA